MSTKEELRGEGRDIDTLMLRRFGDIERVIKAQEKNKKKKLNWRGFMPKNLVLLIYYR